MRTVKTDEFRKDAVWIAQTSGLSRQQIADDPLAGRRLPSRAVGLGVGMSTLTKWITAHRGTDVVSHADPELALALANERLCATASRLNGSGGTLGKPESALAHWS